MLTETLKSHGLKVAGHSAADSDKETAIAVPPHREARDTGVPKIKVDVNVSLPKEEQALASGRSAH